MNRAKGSRRARKPRVQVVEMEEEDVKPDVNALNALMMAPTGISYATEDAGRQPEWDYHTSLPEGPAESPPDIKPDLSMLNLLAMAVPEHRSPASPMDVKPDVKGLVTALEVDEKRVTEDVEIQETNSSKPTSEILKRAWKQEPVDHSLVSSGNKDVALRTVSSGLWGSVPRIVPDKNIQEERFLRFRVPRKPRISGAQPPEPSPRRISSFHVDQDPIVIHLIAFHEYSRGLAAIVDDAREKTETRRPIDVVELPDRPPEMKDPAEVVGRLAFPPAPLTGSVARQILWKSVAVISAHTGFVDADPGVVDFLADLMWDYLRSLCTKLKQTKERIAYGVHPQVDNAGLLSVICESAAPPSSNSKETMLDWYNRSVIQNVENLAKECEAFRKEYTDMVREERRRSLDIGHAFSFSTPRAHIMPRISYVDDLDDDDDLTLSPGLPKPPLLQEFDLEQTLQSGNSWQQRGGNPEEDIPLDSALDMIEQEGGWEEQGVPASHLVGVTDEMIEEGHIMPRQKFYEEIIETPVTPLQESQDEVAEVLTPVDGSFEDLDSVFPHAEEDLPKPSPLVIEPHEFWPRHNREDDLDDLLEQRLFPVQEQPPEEPEARERKRKRSRSEKSAKRSRKKKRKSKTPTRS